MKKVIALAALLLAASACTTTTENTNGNANAANSNAAATPASTPQGVTQADIEAKERQAWEALKAKNRDAFAAMLSDDFVYVMSDGSVSNKAQTVEDIKKYDLTEYTLSDVRLVKVDADAVVLTYTATEKGTYDGKANSGKPARLSSAWLNRNGTWALAYHQESEVAEPPAGGPTPAASPASSPVASSSPSSSPAASPAAPATATDAEKQVWDDFKRKDWDGFDAFLASEFVEVEPDGVYDKAGAVAGIKKENFANVTLGDFKETKFDADATLVTYTAKGTGKDWPPHGMRHTTIWTNRGDRWRAYFHQGTVAAK
ncbi:MAG: hypothetical protein QOJ76_3568 [Acidobacteriota bacterium]|nr:hypothetical protein [Acidobacteriota bacterium]